MPLRERDTSTVQAAADAFLSSPRYASLSTRRGYTGVLDRLLAGLDDTRHAISGCAEVSWSLNKTLAIQTRMFCAGAERRAIVDPISLPFARRVTPQRVP